MAIEKASLDLADKYSDGKFSNINKINKNRQLELAESVGLDKGDYELIK